MSELVTVVPFTACAGVMAGPETVGADAGPLLVATSSGGMAKPSVFSAAVYTRKFLTLASPGDLSTRPWLAAPGVGDRAAGQRTGVELQMHPMLEAAELGAGHQEPCACR
ncbi:hypothetical protein [Nonomuraea insulae]|uniref:Uncharacterized protein n=1 Tax=Nonomuraea insulae TaxID=1616787 RepID=A0ABW1CPZ5_9ACTN